MILTLDRTAGTIEGGGILTEVEPTGDVWPYWCRDAQAAGIDLQGIILEMWDRGCDMGSGKRAPPMLCLTIRIRHANKLKLPPFPAPKKEKS